MYDKMIRRKVKEKAQWEALLTKLMAFDLVILKCLQCISCSNSQKIRNLMDLMVNLRLITKERIFSRIWLMYASYLTGAPKFPQSFHLCDFVTWSWDGFITNSIKAMLQYLETKISFPLLPSAWLTWTVFCRKHKTRIIMDNLTFFFFSDFFPFHKHVYKIWSYKQNLTVVESSLA